MRKLLLLCSLLATSCVTAETGNDDWRQTGDQEEKLNNIVQVIPSAADIMFQMGERYRNLYWAGKQGKREFAQYQTEEMQRLVNTLIITSPKRADTAKVFLHDAFDGYKEAIAQKDWQKFQGAFEHMRVRCMACHIQNEHAYVLLKKQPAKGNSPVLD
jgi:hypothetical protein